MDQQLNNPGFLPRNRPEGLIDQLLALLSDAVIESDALRTHEFRARLHSYRQRLASTSGTADYAKYSGECLQICDEYFKLTRIYMSERETGFGEIIQTLRESIGLLAGDTDGYNGQLMQTSERFNRLSAIQDVHLLKKQIQMECREFKRVVVEKQKRDQASYSMLNRRIEGLQRNLEQTRMEAALDGLTRVANRASFDKALNRWVAAHKSAKTAFILALLDLDKFKGINDRHGHPVGDRVLLSAAQWFRKFVRSNDFLARFGGDEFAILVSDLTLDQASARFAGLLEGIAGASNKFSVPGDVVSLSFTVSCGIAEYAAGESAESLSGRADAAMYEAKRQGRNRVVIAGPPQSKTFWNSLKPLVPFKV
jgi:diguanylate cyclase